MPPAMTPITPPQPSQVTGRKHHGDGTPKLTEDTATVVSAASSSAPQSASEAAPLGLVSNDPNPPSRHGMDVIIPNDADFVDFTPPSTEQLHWNHDRILANEMKSLTMQQREKVYEEIHGVSTALEETPEILETALQQLQTAIDKIPRKAAYLQALQQNADFVLDRNFQLRFLRSQAHNAKDAAHRLVRHFETKLELWGADKLTKNITIDDFDDEMKQLFFDGGSMQLLPCRDTSGRAITLSWEKYQRQFFRTDDPKHFMNRLFWYYMMSFSEDVETQINGIVYIGYGLDFVARLDEDELNVWWGCCGVANVMPVRITGFHYCYNDPKLQPIISLLSLGVVGTVRCRIRTHLGTHQECLYSLMTFGIPYDALPINTDGEWRRTSFLKWAQRRYKKEQNIEKYKDAVELPSRSDVLLGRGKPNQAHAGNKYLHDVIASKYEQYDMSSRREKTKIATDLVQSIKDASGRFLKRDENDIWMEVDDHTAREKVCHGFRRKREVNTITMKQTAMAEAAQQQQRLRQKHEQMLASTTLLPQMTGSAASWNFMSQQAQQQVLMQRAFGSMAAGGGADMSNGGIGSGKCMQFPAMGFGSNNEVNNVQFPMQQQQQCCSFQPMPNTW